MKKYWAVDELGIDWVYPVFNDRVFESEEAATEYMESLDKPADGWFEVHWYTYMDLVELWEGEVQIVDGFVKSNT